MRIAYLFDRPLPAIQTDSEQVMKTVAALARRGVDVSLVLPARPGTESESAAARADALRQYYQVEGEFSVHELPNPARSPSNFDNCSFKV